MRKFVVVFATVALLLQAGTALANNAWGTNHWAADSSGRASMTFSTNDIYEDDTKALLSLWSGKVPLDPDYVSRKGDIVVTTGKSVLWLGRAQIWVDGSGHITKGQVKMNTSLLTSSLYPAEATAHVLCQELGHIFGLSHDTDNQGGMGDGSGGQWFSDLRDHDIDTLNTIYGHTTDGASGDSEKGGGGKPNGCNPNKPGCTTGQSSGRWVTVHTFWAPTNH